MRKASKDLTKKFLIPYHGVVELGKYCVPDVFRSVSIN